MTDYFSDFLNTWLFNQDLNRFLAITTFKSFFCSISSLTFLLHLLILYNHYLFGEQIDLMFLMITCSKFLDSQI